jgi:hypothetical protein
VYEQVAQGGSITINLPEANKELPDANWTYTLESLPLEGSIQPINISEEIPNGIIRYEADSNFAGIDYLTYKVHNQTDSTTLGSITIETYAVRPIIADPVLRIIVSFVTAIGSIIAITLVAWRIISKLRLRVNTAAAKNAAAANNPINTSRFWDIIRSNNMDPSLSVF